MLLRLCLFILLLLPLDVTTREVWEFGDHVHQNRKIWQQHVHRHNHGYKASKRVASKHPEKIPDFHLMKRQIVNFDLDWRARVTIVYRTQHEFTVRWFRTSINENLAHAELPNMIRVDEAGDDHLVETIQIGDVKGSILVVARVQSFPVKYCAVFTEVNAGVQYHVYTSLREAQVYRLDPLDTVYWASRPSAVISFHSRLNLHCVALLESESPERLFTDELSMYRVELHDAILDYTSCGTLHRDGGATVEESGRYLTTGQRSRLPLDLSVYNITFTVSNASHRDQGMYVCQLERRDDRTYVSAWIRQGQVSVKPVAQLLPCEAGIYDKRQGIVYFTKGRETCFRCRGYGFPPPEVQVLKDREILATTDWLHVDPHVNVPDGGIHEATYTIWKPNKLDEGHYECKVRSDLGSSAVNFKAVLIPPNPR